jgi:hypothetical protein
MVFNVIRPSEAPESLLSQSRYDGEDVYKVLSDIFFKKCYICETKEPHDINIEHFYAHQGNVQKKYEWRNLYLACSRCNNIKNANYNNMLDCCDSSYKVFRAIKHVPPTTPSAKSLILVPMNDDERTISTHQLLDKVYNSDHTINKKVSSVFLRQKIFTQYNLLLDQINKYFAPVALESEKTIAIERIKILIDKSAPYSAFIRWCVLEDTELGPLLENFMD